MDLNRKLVLLTCRNYCQDSSKRILSELLMNYGDSVFMMPVSCPTNLKPLSFISILKQGWGGLLVLCPKESCNSPKKLKSLLRRDTLKSILPVFGISREKLEVLQVSSSDTDIDIVKETVAKMFQTIELESRESVRHTDSGAYNREYKTNIVH